MIDDENDSMDLYGVNASLETVTEKEKHRKKEIEELESKSKPLHELVQTFNAMVRGALSQTRIDNNSGLKTRLVLYIKPDSLSVPIRTLYFQGISIVKAGDYISVKVPRYEEKKLIIHQRNPFSGSKESLENTLFLDREFKSVEEAIELTIHYQGEAIRTDQVINYNRFLPKDILVNNPDLY